MKMLDLGKLVILAGSLALAPTLHAATTTTKNTNNAKQTKQDADAQIVTIIQQKFASKGSTGNQVTVNSRKGNVSVNGDVKTDDDAIILIEIAESTPGVKNVDSSKLTVNGAARNTNQGFMDSMTTAKIKGSFVREKVFNNQDIAVMAIKVETNNGVVHLSGVAENKNQAENAERIAKTVKGVKKVQSTIEVKPAS